MHWYDNITGEPRYEIPYADGRPGKTPTLTDARKLNLVPSVTSVLGILDKPGLNTWKVDQAVLAALTNPVIHDGMPQDEMLAIIRRDAEAYSKMAMQRGSDIHDTIEKCFAGTPYANEYVPHASAAIDLIYMTAGAQYWQVEAHLPGGLGYGGRCDLYNDEYLVDFKTKEFNEHDIDAGKVKGWPEQEVQLVAYDLGFGGGPRRLVNVFVSTTVPGLVHWFEWPAKNYDNAVEKWWATLNCWYAWRNYKPL